jgi:DNA-binding GntR family transcriptional regulator
MRKAAKASDIDTQLTHDIAFHRVLVELADNRALLAAWPALGIEVPTAFGVFWTYFDRMELVDFHPPIVDALRDGDVARAGREARRHVQRTEKVVRRRRRERTPKVAQ